MSEQCNDWKRGMCNRGQSCIYAHVGEGGGGMVGREECADYKRGMCHRETCANSSTMELVAAAGPRRWEPPARAGTVVRASPPCDPTLPLMQAMAGGQLRGDETEKIQMLMNGQVRGLLSRTMLPPPQLRRYRSTPCARPC